MNNIHQTNSIFNYTIEVWEEAFTTYIQSNKETKEYDNAIKIMMSIDRELTVQLLEIDSSDNVITVYHGTHQDGISFTNNRTITNYNHIGTWFTSSFDNAYNFYGNNVIKANIKFNNPFIIQYESSTDFDTAFINKELMEQYNVAINQIWTHGEYIQSLKHKYINEGYDSILFKNSRIDCNSSDKSHDVYIILDTNSIIDYVASNILH